MDRFITHQGDISLWQIDKKGIASLAKFVVEENFMHHEGKMLSSCESSEEYCYVLQEEQAFYEYSSIIVAKNVRGDIVGAIRITCWDKNPHIIPLVKLFGDHLIDLEQLRHDHKHLWHIGRFAINRNYADNGRLFKLLMLYAISPIFRYNRGVLLAEIDQKLLRALGALHITSHIAISPTGDVYPCVYGFGESSLCSGNLKQTSLSKIWHTDKWNMLRGDILLKDLHTCKACSLSNSCQTKNCRVRALKYKRDLYGTPNCTVCLSK